MVRFKLLNISLFFKFKAEISWEGKDERHQRRSGEAGCQRSWTKHGQPSAALEGNARGTNEIRSCGPQMRIKTAYSAGKRKALRKKTQFGKIVKMAP